MAHPNIYSEKAGNGYPLLLVRGFNENATAWDPYLKTFAKHFTVITMDNRGAGRSDAPSKPYTIEEMAGDAKGVLKKHGVEKAHVFGHSMGSLIGMQLAHAHPTFVNKLLLSAPFPYLPEVSKQNLIMELELLESGVPIEQIHRLHTAWIFSNQFFQNPANLEEYIHQKLHGPFAQTKEGTLGQAQALLTCDLRSKLKEIRAPVHLLVGRQDILTPIYLAEQMQKQIPICTMKILDTMSHAFLQEVPEIVAPLALEYLLNSPIS